MRLLTIEFGSLLSYSPHGKSELEERSKTTMTYLKKDEFIPNTHILMSDYISELIKKNIISLPFSSFLTTNPVLVPIPKSSLMRLGTLWVPRRLAKALIQRGFGKAIEECLKRVKALPKSAMSLAKDRPKAADHYDSINVQRIFPDPEEILLIDDVVTRGATILGAANKLADVFPNARIRAFAAMRTISSEGVLKAIYDPCKGEIRFNGQYTIRDP